jgi:hypothetical protein
MRALAFVAALAACGGGQKQAKTTPPPATGPLTPEECGALFDHMMELGAAESDDPAAFRRALAHQRAEFVEGCPADVTRTEHACAMAATELDAIDACAPAEHAQGCEREPGGPVFVSEEAYRNRRGAGITRYSEARSSKAEPLEICGRVPSYELIGGLACDDGSTPAAGKGAEMRSGNVGPGGRCGTIIDVYRVQCPERSYEIYVDMYVCPPP